MKHVICIAWNCDCARAQISRPSVRVGTVPEREGGVIDGQCAWRLPGGGHDGRLVASLLRVIVARLPCDQP